MSGPELFANPYVSKLDVLGRVVVVLRGVTGQRALQLNGHRSRALLGGQIHELMLTDEQVGLDATVQRVALLAFVELTQGGVALVDDEVVIGGRALGRIVGFNDTHMPNHQNVCLHAARLEDGKTLGIQLGDALRIWRRSDDSKPSHGT